MPLNYVVYVLRFLACGIPVSCFCVPQTALVFARLSNDVLYPGFLVVDSFSVGVCAEFQAGVHVEFQWQISPGMDFQPLVKSGIAVFARVPHLHQKFVQ